MALDAALIHYADVRHVPVDFIVVEAVADHKLAPTHRKGAAHRSRSVNARGTPKKRARRGAQRSVTGRAQREILGRSDGRTERVRWP